MGDFINNKYVYGGGGGGGGMCDPRNRFIYNCMLTDDIRDLISPFVVMCTVLSESELLAMRSKLRIKGQSQCSTLGHNSAFYTFFFLLLAGKVHALVQPNEV